MGSYMQAPILGFFCHMCTDLHRHVIHLYGQEARRLQLVEKMEKYLHVRVREWDPMPKTICRKCVQVILQTEQYYFHLARLEKELAGLLSLEEPIDLSTKPSQPDLQGSPPADGTQ